MTVAPSGDHYCIDVVVPSSDHCCTEPVPPSSEHYGTTKVSPPSDNVHTKSFLGDGHCAPLWLRHCVHLHSGNQNELKEAIERTDKKLTKPITLRRPSK